MKADTIRNLAAQGCNVAEIAAFLGMDPYRVRWLLKRDCAWPRRDHTNAMQRRLNRLVARLAA